jgi:hypothetical protein
MHEIYLLAVLFNASRHPAAERTRDQRLRDEQAFYDLYSGDGGPGFKSFARLSRVVPVAAAAFVAVKGLAQLLR